MTRIRTKPPLCQFQLPDHDQRWLDSLALSHGTSEDRHGAVKLLNSKKIGISYKPGAVYKAYNSGEIPTALVSGRAMASPYDIVRWALMRKYTSRERDRLRFGDFRGSIERGQ